MTTNVNPIRGGRWGGDTRLPYSRQFKSNLNLNFAIFIFELVVATPNVAIAYIISPLPPISLGKSLNIIFPSLLKSSGRTQFSKL